MGAVIAWSAGMREVRVAPCGRCLREARLQAAKDVFTTTYEFFLRLKLMVEK
jgi:hypothetical protein